ncbi:MAG: HDOD domain-containing protein [Deltaproteobacteria bacterium]|jgi:HD-like signal output (HDOD) protein|nr:HDOD domain-containing protein [Deltaproteobacteria bacterium]
MSFLKKIRRHAAIATGNFGVIFKDVEIPPLPGAVNTMVVEINKAEPDINELVMLISSTTAIAAKVIKTVNSSLFSLRVPVTDIKRAVTHLGLHHIRSIALAFATMDALPKPKGDLFNHKAFWVDSLLRAIMSRSFSKKTFKNQLEEAFTASFLSDVALPVLLCVWGDYYAEVIEEWRQSPKRLSEIERELFGWDHAQAGAWILQSWEFPEEMVCYLGAHNLSIDKIHEYGLNDTIVVPIVVASNLPSILKPDEEGSRRVFNMAAEWLSMTRSEFVDCINEIKASSKDILELFGFSEQDTGSILEDLIVAANSETHIEEM